MRMPPRALLALTAALPLLPLGCSSDSQSGQQYTLYAPMSATETFLLDQNLDVVHIWNSVFQAAHSSFLLDDGSIVRPGAINDIAPMNRFVVGYRRGLNPDFNIGGFVERIAKDDEVLWSFEYFGDDFAPHHVVTVMPNGNLLMPVWRYVTQEEAIALGRDPERVTDGGLWMESIVEVRPTGKKGGEIVWEWRIADHLIQDFDPTKPSYGALRDHPGRIDINYGRGKNVPEDFIHVNSAFYIEEYDQIAMSSYHYSELWVIDHSTTTAEAAGSTGGKYGRGGDLLYRWGNPWVYGRDDTDAFLLSVVHDPKWVSDEGRFIMYDNNVEDVDRGLSGGDSMVVEIEPPMLPDGSYVLESDGVYGPKQPVQASDLVGIETTSVGTAERLSNGRTLSCDCPNAQRVWLESDGSVASVDDLYTNTGIGADDAFVFRIVGYSGDDAGVQALQ